MILWIIIYARSGRLAGRPASQTLMNNELHDLLLSVKEKDDNSPGKLNLLGSSI